METTNFRGELKKNEPLSRHTSFCIGGPADVLALPADIDDLLTLVQEVRGQGLKYLILGAGTNLLVRDGGVRGVVISLQNLHVISIEREYRSVGGNYSVVSAQAGALLPKLLAFAIEKSLTGLEFATGIPGTVGGAVCMNAGTAQGEIGDIIESVTLLDTEGKLVVRSREEMGFGYRTSNIPAGHVVVEVKMVLRKDDREKIRMRVKELQEKRKQRQPGGAPNAGSIFKNPHEESAGRLIETARLKGRRVGDAQVSDKHANFILNVGKATARDVLELMEVVKQTVLEAKGVRLEPEIKIIGED